MSVKGEKFMPLHCHLCMEFVCYGSNGYVTVFCANCQPEQEEESYIIIKGDRL